MTEKISLDVGMLKKDCTEALQKTFNGISKNVSKYFKFERNDKQSEAAKSQVDYPRYDISIDREAFMKSLPISIRQDPAGIKKAMMDYLDFIQEQMRHIDPKDDIIHFDDVVIKSLNTDIAIKPELTRKMNEVIQRFNSMNIAPISQNDLIEAAIIGFLNRMDFKYTDPEFAAEIEHDRAADKLKQDTDKTKARGEATGTCENCGKEFEQPLNPRTNRYAEFWRCAPCRQAGNLHNCAIKYGWSSEPSAVKEELPFDDEPAENQDSAKWFTSGYAAPLKCDSPYLAAKVDRERQIEVAMMDISRIMRLTAAEADTLRDSLFSLIAAADNNAKTTQDLVDGLKASEGTAASSMGQAKESWTGAKTSE